MEENREQPIIMPATALDQAEENLEETSAVSEIGSQTGDLGKFKSVEALMDAYNSLQAEFTKKCQALSELKKDKADEVETSISEEMQEVQGEDALQTFNEDNFNQFLQENADAQGFADEIKEKFSSAKNHSPYEVAWAKVLLNSFKEKDEKSDQIINQYVLSNENVKNKIIENYLQELSQSKPPMVISSQSGERVSGIIPDAPKTLKDAKKIVNKMFS